MSLVTVGRRIDGMQQYPVCSRQTSDHTGEGRFTTATLPKKARRWSIPEGHFVDVSAAEERVQEQTIIYHTQITYKYSIKNEKRVLQKQINKF